MRAQSSFSAPLKIEVRDAGKKGRGVFATKPIRAGETIEMAPALLIPPTESDDVLTSFLAHYIFKTDKGSRYVIGLGLVSMVNHADEPNAEFYVMRHCVQIKALRGIKPGSEVTVDYGWTKREWATVGGQEA